MKILITLFCALSVFQLFALDTSGCSPMNSQNLSKVTVNGASLVLTSSKSPISDCWNLSSSGFTIAYIWGQNVQTSQYSQVGFYVKVNNLEFPIDYSDVDIRCTTSNSLSYSHNTNGQQNYLCTATTYVKVGNNEAWDIEIAPQVDGSWDTAGFRKDYKFSL